MTAARRGPAAWIPWAALALVVVVALVIGSGATSDRTIDDRVHSIALTIKCPQCSGQSVATSEATTAVAIRNDIEARLRRGDTPDEIRDYYGNHYGEAYLLNPSSSGSTRLVWVLPVVVIFATFGGLALAFRRWRLAEVAEVTDADRDLVRAAQHGMSESPDGEPEPGEPLDATVADGHGEGDGR